MAPSVRDLLVGLDRLRYLDGDPTPVGDALADVAVDVAEGRRAPAEERLARMRGELERELDQRTALRWRSLETRRESLSRAGLQLPVLVRTEPSASSSDAFAALREEEQRVARWERDWAELAQLRSDAVETRELARSLGAAIPPELVSSVVPRGRPRASELEELLPGARDRVAVLFRFVTPFVRETIARRDPASVGSGAGLSRTSGPRAGIDAIERALDHGRVLEAMRAVVGWSRPPPATDRTISDRSGSVRPDDMSESTDPLDVESLLAKIEGVAENLRSLPADSDEARSAAAGIREATELLRAGRLADADRALSRLVDRLAESPGEATS